MVVKLLANAGHILQEELTYEMLYIMFEKINSDLNGSLYVEKEALKKIFKVCEEKNVPAEKAVIKHTVRITSFTNTAMFQARQVTA